MRMHHKAFHTIIIQNGPNCLTNPNNSDENKMYLNELINSNFPFIGGVVHDNHMLSFHFEKMSL